jgi:hypothetical protein
MVALSPIRLSLIATLLLGAARAPGVDFEREIFPLLESRCLECHDTAR